LELAAGVNEPDPAPETRGRELHPRQRIDGYEIGGAERADVAHDRSGVAALQGHPHALAQPRDVGASDGAVDDKDDRGISFRSQWIDRSRGQKSSA
jgi:hypothetical protein